MSSEAKTVDEKLADGVKTAQESISQSDKSEATQSDSVSTALNSNSATRTLTIAVANNSVSKAWKNEQITICELHDRLKNTIRTSETVAEYAKMSKTDRASAKDHGGFVGGKLKDKRRLLENVECRSMLTLDVDHAEADFLDKFKSTFQYTAFVYSTHGHTSKEQRYRIIIPLARDVSTEEYVAMSRYMADSYGINQFDECSYRPHQLMYWPSTPKDGEYVFEAVNYGVEVKPVNTDECSASVLEDAEAVTGDANLLDPDAFLSSHPDWTDPTKLPMSSRETRVSKPDKKVEDPLTKSGVIGAFCRAYYPISLAIGTFLDNVYEKSESENRYHLIGSDSVAGVIIHDDKYSYSFHAKDPAYMRLLNAFDLVRVHKFGDDEKSSEKMIEFALTLDTVKEQLVQDRLASAKDDFVDLGDDDTDISSSGNDGSDVDISSSSSSGSDNIGTASDSGSSNGGNNSSNNNSSKGSGWFKKLKLNKKTGEIINCTENLMLILNNDVRFKYIAYDELANKVRVVGKVPWDRPVGNPFWRDADAAQLKMFIDKTYATFSERNYDVAFKTLVDQRRFHPIRDYLDALPPWDGVERLERLFVNYLGAEDSEYTRTVTRKTFTAAVARIYQPGIKFDTALILGGPQGLGKSTIFTRMADPWFSDSLALSDMKDKTGAEKIQGNWVLELGELAGMRKADLETVKSFVSRMDDEYRQAYGRTTESHPRQCIIVGTTNKAGFLRDITGNRRFWPVKVEGSAIGLTPFDIDKETVDNLWAEALHYYKNGETLYLDRDMELVASEKQREAMEDDERQGMVEEYLETLLPTDWDDMDLNERRVYLSEEKTLSGSGKHVKIGSVKRTEVSNIEIWSECFRCDPASIKSSDSYQIAAIMVKIEGWERTDKIKRQKLYGRQKIYMRV